MAFTDDFVGTSGDYLADRAGWTQVGGLAGAAQIGNSNTLQCLSGTPDSCYLCADQGSADQYTQVSWINSRDGGFACVRMTDASNFIGFRHQSSGAKWTIYKRAGGVFTLLGQVVQALVSRDVGRLEIVGDEWSFYVNGVLKLGPTTETFNNTETRQGLSVRSVNANPWIDDFEAGSLSTGPAVIALSGDAVAEATATGTLPANVALEGAASASAKATGKAILNGVFHESDFSTPNNIALEVSDPSWDAWPVGGTKKVGVLDGQLYGSELGNISIRAKLDFAAYADYSVSLDITALVANLGGGSRVSVIGRLWYTDYYEAAYDGISGEVRLSKSEYFVGQTILGAAPVNMAAGQTSNLRLEMVGTTLSVYFDNVQLISVVDTFLTDPGRVGVGGYTASSTHWRADNFKASYATSAETTAADLAGTASAQAAAAAALSVSVPLAAAGLSVSTAAGALSVTVPNVDLSGNATATANATGGLSLSIPLSGAAVAQALASAGITQSTPLSGAAIAQALASAALVLLVPLSGAASGQAAATGVMDTAGTASLSGAAVAQAVSAASLSLGVPIAGAAIAQAVASAGLSNGITLSGAAVADAVAAAGLSKIAALSGLAQSVAIASAGLDLSTALTGSAAAQASASGGLSLNVSLSGAAIADAVASAGLTTVSGSSLSGNAQAAAAASGVLTHAVPLSGASLAVSSASGNLTQIVPLSGSAASASMATGGLDISVQLSGAALAQAMAEGGITHVIAAMLSGSASGEAGASGSLTLRINLDGGALAQAVASGALTAQGLMYGAAPGWSISADRRNWSTQLAARSWGVSAPRRSWSIKQSERNWGVSAPPRNWRVTK